MLNFIKTFRADEDGAVTVDWVVLTAALVLLGLFVITQVGGGVSQLTGEIVTDLGTVDTVLGDD